MQFLATEERRQTIAGEAEDEIIEQALAWHGGDARSTIATLLADCGYLRGQLAIASAAMGHGFSRGWRPAPSRTERRLPGDRGSEAAAGHDGLDER